MLIDQSVVSPQSVGRLVCLSVRTPVFVSVGRSERPEIVAVTSHSTNTQSEIGCFFSFVEEASPGEMLARIRGKA
eukprot:scaffold1356_cov123-Cylindrotheca_fusiformis.AAC.1